MMTNGVESYRMIDADYAFVGSRFQLARAGVRDVVDSLRYTALRVGVVMVEAGNEAWAKDAELLAQVRAVGIVETGWRGRELSEALASALRRAEDSPEWCDRNQRTRIYMGILSPGSEAIKPDHLKSLAHAMHVYQPERLLLTPDGGATPSEMHLYQPERLLLTPDGAATPMARRGTKPARVESWSAVA